MQLVDFGTSLVYSRLAALLGAAVHQIIALFTKAIHGEKGSGALPQQALKDGMDVRFDTETGIHRVAAVLVTQLFKACAVALLRSCKTPSNLSGPNPAAAPVRSRGAPALRHAPGPSVLAVAGGPA